MNSSAGRQKNIILYGVYMEKYLITGFSGFVCRHLLDLIEKEGEKSSVTGIDLSPPDFDITSYSNIKINFIELNLMNSGKLESIISECNPDYIIHLAAFSSVGRSWKEPQLSFTNNTGIFLNIIDAVRKLGIKCRILSVGSSEVYGNYTPEEMPLKENYCVRPVSPYAVARVSQEQLSSVYTQSFGLDIVMTRSFNHIGPWQKDIFVIPSFVKKILEIKNISGSNREMFTGDISIIRDFLDVRDVVKAYFFLLKKGQTGSIYNISSGEGHSLRQIIDLITEITSTEIDLKLDQKLIRPGDNRVIIGSNLKLVRETGWKQTFSLKQTIKDIIGYWEDIL